MKPLFHPNIKDIKVEAILHALSDPTRLKIYADIAKSECSKICSAFIDLDNIQLPKSTLSQHFRILREAGLIQSERKGVEMHNVTRCAELHQRFGDLIPSIIRAYSEQNKPGKKSKSKKK